MYLYGKNELYFNLIPPSVTTSRPFYRLLRKISRNLVLCLSIDIVGSILLNRFLYFVPLLPKVFPQDVVTWLSHLSAPSHLQKR